MPKLSKQINRKQLTINIRALSKPGFTFIEILLTLLFSTTLAIILLTTVGTLVQTHRSNLQSIATRIATKEVETLKNTAYTSLPASGSFSDPDISKLPSGTASRTMANYQGSQEIKQATITVNWVNKGVSQSVNLTTLIYENGL